MFLFCGILLSRWSKSACALVAMLKLSAKDEAYVQQMEFDVVTPVELTGDSQCDRLLNKINAMGADAWTEVLRDGYRKAIALERTCDVMKTITPKIDQAEFL